MPTSSGQWKRDSIDLDNQLQWMQHLWVSRELLLSLLQQNPRNPVFIQRFLNQHSQPATRLSVDRAIDRPHPPVDRAPNRELGHFSRSTGRSTELLPCACCARRSTGPVDRSPATAGGRSARSTDFLLLLLTCFAVVLPSSFVDDFLDDPCRLPRQSLSLSNRIMLTPTAIIKWMPFCFPCKCGNKEEWIWCSCFLSCSFDKVRCLRLVFVSSRWV